MRDVNEVLREKEVEITRVRHEIAALRLILPLADEVDDVPVDAPAYPHLQAVGRN